MGKVVGGRAKPGHDTGGWSRSEPPLSVNLLGAWYSTRGPKKPRSQYFGPLV
jgi:hypothetical protein